MSDAFYDVVIVGAGAAGCAAAMNLPQGARALLVDRGDPAAGRCCGGLLAPDAQAAVAGLGLTLPEEVRVAPEPKAVHVHDLDSGREQTYRRNYINLDRAKFDAWLLALATRRAEFRPHTRLAGLRLETAGEECEFAEVRLSCAGSEETIRAAVVIAADGARSAVRYGSFSPLREEAPEPLRMLAIQVRLAAADPPPVHEVLFAGRLTDFYAWAIPKPGAVLVGAAFSQPRGARERFEEILAWYRENLGLGGEVLERSARALTRPRTRAEVFPGARGVLMTGEAAGLVSPSSGEGLSFALESGAAAGRAIADAMRESPDDPFSWRTRACRHYEKTFAHLARRVARKFIKARVIFSPALRRLALRLPWCP